MTAQQKEMVYTVDAFMAQVRKRSMKAVEKELNGGMKRAIIYFPTELQAWEFIVSRSENQYESAKAALEQATVRLRGHRKKLLELKGKVE